MIRFAGLYCLVFILISCVEKRDLKENTLYVHLNVAVQSMHVTNDQTAVKQFVYSVLQKTLYTMDLRTHKATPILIESMPSVSADSLIYTFTLKKDVRWDNGEQLTAKDVDFSVKLNLCELSNNGNVRAVYRGLIDSIRLYPSDPLKFDLVVKSNNILNASCLSELYIMQTSLWDPKDLISNVNYQMIQTGFKPSKEVDRWFKNFNDPINGSTVEGINGLGPYKAVDWNEQGIICERKTNWWGVNDTSLYNANDPDKIVFRIIADQEAAIASFRRGQLDFTGKLGAKSLSRLRKSSAFEENYQFEEVGQHAYTFVAWNIKADGIKHPKLFTDKRVRKALAHLTPTDEIIEVFLMGKGERQNASILPLKRYYNKELETIRLNHKEAERLLDEAGWKDTDGDNIRDKVIDGQKVQFSFKMMYIKGGDFGEMVSMIANEMRQSGIKVIPEGLNQDKLVTQLFTHDYDAVMVSLQGDGKYDDPSQIWKTESWANHGMNFTGFGNAYTDSLIDVVNSQTTDAGYVREILKFQEVLYEEQPFVFMYQVNQHLILHKRFNHHGFFTQKPGAIINAFKLNSGYLKKISA